MSDDAVSDIPQHDRAVVHTSAFLPDDPKWGGVVDVVRRKTTVHGNTSEYIDIVLRVGSRFLVLPWRGLDGIVEAIGHARAVGEPLRSELLASLPARPRRAFDDPQRGDRSDRRSTRRRDD